MSFFQEWLLRIAGDNYFLYIKRLSANDTGATGGHQVGLYISSDIAEKLLPSINNTQELNPSVFLTAHVSSHEYPDSEARAIYYNNRFFLAGPGMREESLAGEEEAHSRILKIQEPLRFWRLSRMSKAVIVQR